MTGIENDSFSFFDDPAPEPINEAQAAAPAPESTGQGTAAPAPAPLSNPDAVTIPKSEWEAFQQRVQAQERFQQNMAQVFNPNAQQQPQNIGPEWWNQFATNPLQEFDRVKREAKEEARKELIPEALDMFEERLLINEYKSKHPEMAQFERYIAQDVTEFIEEAFRQGRQPTKREAIEEGIKRFKSKFQTGVSQLQQLQQSNNVQRLALNLDAGNGGQPQPQGLPDPSTLSEADFYKAHQKLQQQSRGY